MTNASSRRDRGANTVQLVPTGALHVDGDHTFDFGSTILSPATGDDLTEPIVRFSLIDAYEDKGAIWARLTVSKLGSGIEPLFPPILGPIRVNLMNHTRAGWGGMKEQLEEQMPDWNWELMLGVVKAKTLDALDEPIPRVNLADAALERSAKPPYLLKPYIASSGVSVLYGDGGTGKSVIALGMGIEVSTGAVLLSDQRAFTTGPVVYADYEDEASEHANRVAAICKGNDIEMGEVEIYHLALVAKVSNEIKRLRQTVHDVKAVLVILDSIGMGRGGDALGPEDTIRMFRGLRSLGVPVLAIDHVSKESKSRKGKPDPYGSIYTRNSSRMAWHVEQRAPLLGDPWEYLALQHTKANHVRKQRPRFLKVKYVNALAETGDGEAVEMIHSLEFEQTDMSGMPPVPDDKESDEKASRITLADEIVAAVFAHGGPMTVRELADQLGRAEGTIRKTCHRAVEGGQLISTDDGYGLPDDDKPIPF